jgi:hypothetical protein
MSEREALFALTRQPHLMDGRRRLKIRGEGERQCSDQTPTGRREARWQILPVTMRFYGLRNKNARKVIKLSDPSIAQACSMDDLLLDLSKRIDWKDQLALPSIRWHVPHIGTLSFHHIASATSSSVIATPL